MSTVPFNLLCILKEGLLQETEKPKAGNTLQDLQIFAICRNKIKNEISQKLVRSNVIQGKSNKRVDQWRQLVLIVLQQKRLRLDWEDYYDKLFGQKVG